MPNIEDSNDGAAIAAPPAKKSTVAVVNDHSVVEHDHECRFGCGSHRHGELRVIFLKDCMYASRGGIWG